MKKLTAALCLVLCLSVVLCACGTDATETTPQTTTEPVATTTEPATTAPSGNVTYTVCIVDGEGNPIPGVTVQFCDDANVCRLPVVTDAEGKVTQTYPEANYHISITVAPEGYSFDADGYYFNPGETELTIALTVAG